ncbi:MAG: ABC transporter permease [Anaerolineales bacterium]|nr:ABC transporter permease [Anaerolineales bacterium]
MKTFEPVFALAWKDWTLFRRQPFLVMVSVIMPLVFIFFYAIIVPTSSTNGVVVALESEAAEAQAFVTVLETIRSQEAVYYRVETTDPIRARQIFEARRAFGLIVIPADFATRLKNGEALVELHIHNINADYSKNLRLRLDYAVREFSQQIGAPTVAVQETPWLTHDPKMQDYISTSLLLFACLYSAMLNTGLQVAGEWNDRTVKSLLLAPVSRWAIVAGKMLAGLGQSLLSVGLVVLVLLTAFHFRPVGSGWAMAGIVAVVMLLGAGLGAMVGVASKNTLAVTSGLIAASILIFLISGNEDSVRGLAWSGPIVALWHVSRALPTTYAFLAARAIFLTGNPAHLAFDLSITLISALLSVAGAAFLLRRAYSHLPGGQ